MSASVKLLAALIPALVGVLASAAQGVEPPLPGEDSPRPIAEAFQPLLQPGDELPPGSEAPALPEGPAITPPELFPEGMPGAVEFDGSDGIDGLPLPPGDPVPALTPSPPADGRSTPLLPAPALTPGLPELELAARAYWHRSPREAREISRRERKPLLIYFYQRMKSAPAGPDGKSMGDPNVSISDDLLASKEFIELANNSMVLTMLFYPIGSPSKTDYPEAKLAALAHFKSHFKIKGFPTLLLLDENGREIERVSGYARRKTHLGVEISTAPPILERLRTAVERREAVVAAADERLRRLTAQNYREWTSKAGTKLFAKLVSATADEVTLMDETGALRRVPLEQLWIVDQAVIHRQNKGQQQAAAK